MTRQSDTPLLEATGIRCLPPTVIVPLHDQYVKCMAFSPDGSELVFVAIDHSGQYVLTVHRGCDGSQSSWTILAMPSQERDALPTEPVGLFYEPGQGRLLIVLSKRNPNPGAILSPRKSELRFIEGSRGRLSEPLKMGTEDTIKRDVDYVAFGTEGRLAVGTYASRSAYRGLHKQLIFKRNGPGPYVLTSGSQEQIVYDGNNPEGLRNAIRSELDQPPILPGSPNHVAALSLSNPRANLSGIWRYTRNREAPLIWSCFDPNSKISCLLYANGTVIFAFEDNVYSYTVLGSWFGAKPIRIEFIYLPDRLHLLALYANGRVSIYEVSSHNSKPKSGRVVAKMHIPQVRHIRRLVISPSGSIAYCLEKGSQQITIVHPG